MTPRKNLIFDIGMHIGQDTEFYLKKGFCVVAVEANPKLVEENTKKFKHYIDKNQLVIEPVCIGKENGFVDFYVNNEVTEWSSVNKVLGSRKVGSNKISVQMTTYYDLAVKYGTPYYLKIDIEGADLFPIMDLRRCKTRPAYVSYEAAGIGGAAYLFSMGYSEFKLVMQRDLHTLVQPEVALEGKSIEHSFPLGSSGPFGEETGDVWSSLEDCVSDYVAYKHFRRADNRRPADWADFHAKSSVFLKQFEHSDIQQKLIADVA